MRDYIMTDRFVAILMGSDSDLPQMQGAIDVLKKFSIRTEVKRKGLKTLEVSRKKI